jgi:hypothetical protein
MSDRVRQPTPTRGEGNPVAVRIIEKLIDDLTGGTADETVTFALDGILYTIDLNQKNAARLRTTLQPYMQNGHKQRKRKPPRSRR